MEIIEKVVAVTTIVVLILIIITSVNNEPKPELTFEEKKEEAYFDCISRATVNRDADLLRACDEVLKINKEL